MKKIKKPKTRELFAHLSLANSMAKKFIKIEVFPSKPPWREGDNFNQGNPEPNVGGRVWKNETRGRNVQFFWGRV
jgi:hypothetical protein